MKDLIRCDTCNGRKRVLGMGGMEKPCPNCKAIGWVEVEMKTKSIAEKLPELQSIPRKKPGPKPKSVVAEA